VCAGFEMVNAEFSKLRAGEGKYREAISSTVVKIHEAIREADAQTTLLAARVGRDHTDASDLGSETAWDVIRRLCEAMGEVQKHLRVTAMEVPNLLSHNVNATTKMSTLSQNLHGLRQFTQGSLGVIHQRMRTLENGGSSQVGSPAFIRTSEYQRLMERLQFLEDQAKSYINSNLWSSASGDHEDEVSGLKRRLDEMEKGLKSGGEDNSGGRFGYGQLDMPKRRVATLEDKADFGGIAIGQMEHDESEVREQIADLSKRLDKAEAKGSDEIFELDGYTFASFSDFTQYVKGEKMPTSGVFWGLSSVLITMRPKGLSGKERADKQYASEQIQTSVFENSLLALTSHAQPACLYAIGGVGVLVGLEEGFRACPSYAKWINGLESLKKVLGKQLKDYDSGIQGNMVLGAGGNGLAKALLAQVKAQWYKFISWAEEFYKQLTEEANFKLKAPTAWRLMGRCALAIFDAMAEPRAKVAFIEDPKPLENKASIMWAVLQCPTILQKFIEARFGGHPVIVKEITMFMILERVDPDELVKVEEKLAAAVAANTQTKGAMQKLEENYSNLKRTLDNLVNDFKPIKTKVQAKL
jgi:hypothetical protein